MALVYKEATFPVHYREAQVRPIMTALYRLRSITVTGAAGMGKSNVVRFILSHAAARTRYLHDRADDYVFAQVDGAGLGEVSEAGVLREIAVELERAGLMPSPGPTPADEIRRAFKARWLNIDPRLNMVIVFDEFEAVAARLNKEFFNYLAHLRNARPRGNVSYLFVARRPVGDLGSLQELLDDSCTIGPFDRRDALDAIQRDERRLDRSFSPGERDQLIAVSGGHPGFLKNLCELAGSGRLDLQRRLDEIAEQAGQSEKIKSLCDELWNDFTVEERAVLSQAARGMSAQRATPDPATRWLQQCGLLIGLVSHETALFSPLFAGYVRAQTTAQRGALRITAVIPNQARLETVDAAEQVHLSPKLFAVLLELVEGRGQLLSNADLIERAYGREAAGVSNAALSQIIQRLRRTLDPVGQRLLHDETYTCIETIRDTGYRLNG